ncbi:MAG: acyl-CoA dehydrogenase family protein [Hyphomicrobiaceae bacterium]|nr:acyl-CoA dehydrogenase family protein [Hyphomicrobiaceae bacterium]
MSIAGRFASILPFASRPTPSSAPALATGPDTGPDDVLDRVALVVKSDLAPLVRAIDEDNVYPGDVLRKLGAAGAFRSHIPSANDGVLDLGAAIQAMALAGRECLSTAFCAWCQATFAWYAENTENAGLRQRFAGAAASADKLGGTGLSNPMKSFFGIEKFRLRGVRVAGGYQVKGALPWVSNLGPDHAFGTVFEIDGPAPRRVMAMIPCDHPGVGLVEAGEHLALDGTGTYAVQIRDAFIGDELILADPAEPFVKRVRQGFILLQMGMALGVVRGCIDIQRRMHTSLGHVNCYLEDQPDELEAELHRIEAETLALAADPYSDDPRVWRRVLEVRLAGSALALRAAQAAMLFSGARGYVRAGAAQRRLREAYFVAIVTPATKQLKKMLADLDAAGA